jgi:hypothetical protein
MIIYFTYINNALGMPGFAHELPAADNVVAAAVVLCNAKTSVLSEHLPSQRAQPQLSKIFDFELKQG